MTRNTCVPLLLFAAILLTAVSATAQDALEACRTSPIIPLASGEQPPAKIHVDPPLPGPLSSRGVAIIQYCTENLRIMPVFGPNAVTVSPRIGHIHVALDDLPWVWADASGTPVILQGLPPGRHKVRLDLVDANHHQLDSSAITFVVPEKTAAVQPHAPHE